jgi:hypothetical protein
MRREPLVLAALATVAALATLAAPRPARACGPDFPVSLLHDRADTLGTLPEGEFLTEVAYLVEPRRSYPYSAQDVAPAGPVRDAYLRGRDGDGVDAIRAYQQVRALVDAGFEDGAGLALSSLGQEARLHLRRGDDVTSVRLYAEQAALGHPDGATSLLFVVRAIVEGAGERQLLRDPVGQRLLATYLATRGPELDGATAERLWRELAAIPDVAGADQLAVVAYQRGRWARAAAFAERAGDAPRARWVAARLALRAGDRAAADRQLAVATDAFRARGACTAVEPRLAGERAALAIADGRMTDALALAWSMRAEHPDDVTYVAERLVTIPELIAFVDRLPGAGAPVADHEPWILDDDALRALLGRRLMRAGRHLEAAAYLGPAARAPALVFALAMGRAGAVADPIDRARALYQASRVARSDGLEIMGTAHAPDWELYGAQYDRFAYEEHGLVAGRGLGELARVAASAPARGERYHYRRVAAALALDAAALVPPRSQARAALRCWAARHVHRDGPCAEPDFAGARQVSWTPPPPPPPSDGRWRGPFARGYGRLWLRRLGLLAAGFAAAGLLVLGLTASARRWRRFAPRP